MTGFWPLSYDLNTAISALSGAILSLFLSLSFSLSRQDAISPRGSYREALRWCFPRASREILFN